MKLLREKKIREITEVFLPKEVELTGYKAFKYLRVCKIERLVENKVKTFERAVIGYQFELPIKDNPRKTEWHDLSKERYDTIIEVSKGWQPEYIGRFKIEEKIIGITF